jgi:uncharacterized lipoprotein YddW (UPF0748 family)
MGMVLALCLACGQSGQSPAPPILPKPAAPIRGVWLTNVASQALFSRENIREAVELCESLGFNAIFVVTWNRAHTLYPSAVLQAVTGASIHPDLAGRDPLQELIEEAHSRNIQVHAWFEFGFASSYKDPTGGPLVQARPHWASRDGQGNITEKNDFQWLNAFHPEVQRFISDLVMEVVHTYDIDGIQGDDRLPALPSNGGYDEFTRALYRAETGQEPPTLPTDYDWVKWRSRKLTLYLKSLVEEVRAAKPDMRVTMAPSIYPWSEENYLQDWPTWLQMGLVDYIIPQVYRYDMEKYAREMDKIVDEQVGEANRHKLIPGVLLQVDTYNPSEEMLAQMVAYNRAKGIEGEVYFFYEGIKKFQPFFRQQYKEEVKQTN